MSQQAAVGRGTAAAECRGVQNPDTSIAVEANQQKGTICQSARLQTTTSIGQNKFAAQFMQLQKNVANYLQPTSAAEGYLVAETVCTGREQTTALLLPIDPNALDAADLKIIRTEEVKTVAKRRLKLAKSLKKGYATIRV
jgi:hypothetical protein